MRILIIILSVVVCFTIVTTIEADARESRVARVVKPKRPPKVRTLIVGRAINRPVKAKRTLPPLDD